ncbi:uncharacterized protein LOC110032418 [Phalaenopsis equestris]|uniref:uncharacterized protein LOC110032418 n=1 Tax=Phalaenopsis equestris TaxID=78828 RepID=UPI0009E431FC|nr:uncharacterized protein LOC110032418 [Phalaenopsis equestris]
MAVSAKVSIFLAALQSIFLLQQASLVSADMLSPLLSPVLDGICKAVDCGKGICKVSQNHTFGFMCECNAGWNQFNGSEHFSFLPCVIPQCTISSSCFKNSPAPTPAPAPLPPPPSNLSLFNPCTWSFCGTGDCARTSTFEHRCDCDAGYSNLLNVSSFPCYQECAIGGDCVNLGISVPNSSSSSSSTNLNDNSFAGEISALSNFKLFFMLIASLFMISMT